MSKPRAVVSWSGGKDCCLALHRARKQFEIAGLVTMFTEDGSRTRSHGLRAQVLDAQANALSLPLLAANAAWADYEMQFERLLVQAKRWDITHVVFGDVFPDAHKLWAETVSRRAGLIAVEPLWGEATNELAAEFVAAGGKAIITVVREDKLSCDWLGRTLTLETLGEFADLGIDPGGEYGEYHTVVTAFPGFAAEMPLMTLDSLSHGGCFLLDFVTDPRAGDRRKRDVA